MAQQNLAYVQAHFPGSLTQTALFDSIHHTFDAHNIEQKSVLFATSCCPDEINRDLDHVATNQFGRPFCMGGLAGFPFVGKTGFGAFMHHVPDGGIMFILCASHVGIDGDGTVGKVHRLGMKEASTACGAAVGAFAFCKENEAKLTQIEEGDVSVYPKFSDRHDSQQNFIVQFIGKHYKEVADQADPQAALARVVSRGILADLKAIIPGDLHFPLAIVSGVQINFEGTHSEDYFQPASFTLLKDGKEEDLLQTFYEHYHGHKHFESYDKDHHHGPGKAHHIHKPK